MNQDAISDDIGVNMYQINLKLLIDSVNMYIWTNIPCQQVLGQMSNTARLVFIVLLQMGFCNCVSWESLLQELHFSEHIGQSSVGEWMIRLLPSH